MPTPKDFTSYPSEYREIFEEARDKKQLDITCIDNHEARALRNYLYAYRIAIRNSSDHSSLMELANQLTFEVQGKHLTIKYKSNPFKRALARSNIPV